MTNEDEKRRNAESNEEISRSTKKRPGEMLRERSLYAAPTIIIVYPLVGWFVGWFPYRFWHWPYWVPILTMLMGLAQAIRELYKLSRKIYGREDGETK